MMRCAVRTQAGKLRQYLTFATLAVVTVAACVLAYPHARRGQQLVAASERLLTQGKVEQALLALREAASLGSIPTGSAGTMLDAALKAGDADISRDLAMLLMNKGRPLASGLVGKAAGLLDASGDPTGALALLEKRRAMGALENPETLHLADLLRRDRRFDEALELYAGMLAKNPDDTGAGADRAETLLWMGKPAEAEKAARDMLARKPGSRAARLVLARTLAAGGNTEGAIAEYQKLLGEKP
ncbi:MAG: tetratricopeptide repeat protein [Proteobacteria bacterium]|nr:tetratricopeptide repeat protein [Pseudomonadota bacterium]